jgi:hypothetical protein
MFGRRGSADLPGRREEKSKGQSPESKAGELAGGRMAIDKVGT